MVWLHCGRAICVKGGWEKLELLRVEAKVLLTLDTGRREQRSVVCEPLQRCTKQRTWILGRKVVNSASSNLRNLFEYQVMRVFPDRRLQTKKKRPFAVWTKGC